MTEDRPTAGGSRRVVVGVDRSGGARAALRQAAQEAAARGAVLAGAVRRLLLGSVSARVVRSARVPVLVVPAPQRRREDRRPAHCRPSGRPDPMALATAGR